jgi:3'(2'), 5'-bisphosphate nucleotidase
VATIAVREAMSFCEAARGALPLPALQKADLSPATAADFGSQALVCRALAEAFPDDPIMAEELVSSLEGPGGAAVLDDLLERIRRFRPGARRTDVLSWIDRGRARTASQRFWTLDPLDGTSGFLRQGHYALALALILQGEPVLAVLACPVLESLAARRVGAPLLVAERGGGCRVLSGGGHSTAISLRVSLETLASRARLCAPREPAHASREHADAVAAKLGAPPPLGVDSQVKYALVAAGDAEVYLRLPRPEAPPAWIWDHAAGSLLLEEAGGRATDLAGKPLDFTRGARLESQRGIVATNGLLHEAVLRAVGALG